VSSRRLRSVRAVAWLLGALALASCRDRGLDACSDLVRTTEQLAVCPELPEAQRTALVGAARQLRDLLKAIEAEGGAAAAPKHVVDEMRSVCHQQNARAVEAMRAAHPDCLR